MKPSFCSFTRLHSERELRPVNVMQPPLCAFLWLFTTLVLVTPSRLSAGEEPPQKDWPIFRGNWLQSGVAGSLLPEQLEVRWKIKTKDGIEGTAAIVSGTVYIGALDEHLYALDLATGKEKWKYK